MSGINSPLCFKFEKIEKDFDDIFNLIVQELVDLHSPETSEAQNWFKKVLQYNVPHGKRNRGLAVVYSYQYLVGRDATESDLRIAAVLGWCIEMLQAFFLVSDDIMDSSITRRGQTCWYKRTDVGLIAINDALYMNSSIYSILKKHIRQKPYYLDIVELFQETTQQTIIGQCLDMLTSPTEVNFSNFNMERYKAIVKYKTSYYSFYLPVACALYMSGIDKAVVHNEAKEILLKMGEFFQIQDDYLDCFGDQEITGKIGTDIQDNKCSWLIVQALSRADESQISMLQENYGKKDGSQTEVVKQIYRDLKLEEFYREYEESSYSEITSLIENSSTLLKDLLTFYASKIYKRQK